MSAQVVVAEEQPVATTARASGEAATVAHAAILVSDAGSPSNIHLSGGLSALDGTVGRAVATCDMTTMPRHTCCQDIEMA